MYSYIRSSDPPQLTELYFSEVLPEPDLVSGVRVFVFNSEGDLLFVQEGNGNFDLPGGGREQGETPEDAVAREVYEEAAIHIEKIRWVAYEKLTVIGEKPAKYKRHFPVTYAAYAVAFVKAIDSFSPGEETVSRKFFSCPDAIKQDGILFKNRHIILDKIIEAKLNSHDQRPL
jgi:8-oxo-dGTP pyrophosphatase MutT (NUDIX family)